MATGRDFGQIDNIEMPLQFLFAFVLCGLRIIEYVERVVVCVLGVDAVAGEAAAESVGAVMHRADRVNDACAVFARAVPMEDA